jgi:hypothetical protein
MRVRESFSQRTKQWHGAEHIAKLVVLPNDKDPIEMRTGRESDSTRAYCEAKYKREEMFEFAFKVP